LWAGDSQGGYILKAYREHLISEDDKFLRDVWPRVKRATRFLIEQDANGDGIIEGRQHQTYDQDYFGANTFVGSLYLGALRAAEVMATLVGDNAFATECRTLFEQGREATMKRLFNGEYFIQDVDLKQHPDWQYGDGCLADQLFGQMWAHEVGLGHLYPADAVKTAMRSVWKYNWAPDIAAQNAAHKPERWFAHPGEAGLFTCTWPKSKHLGEKSTRYRDEIWTGIEYQVAAHMIREGLVEEGLAICRAIHERYDASKRNPWNEIECGDHYARALASWSVLTALAGFHCDGPRGVFAFDPKLTPEDFRSVFTGPAGWGVYRQRRAASTQLATVTLSRGRLRVTELRIGCPPGAKPVEVTLNGAR
ncbi:MAG: glycoside hydrolase family 116 protein, partial [Nitrospirae bacterium]|nr:glycoside hydrolase family 116 protein [Fimbriimonadaceae bacterium]